jgi:hypothetical protein
MSGRAMREDAKFHASHRDNGFPGNGTVFVCISGGERKPANSQFVEKQTPVHLKGTSAPVNRGFTPCVWQGKLPTQV